MPNVLPSFNLHSLLLSLFLSVRLSKIRIGEMMTKRDVNSQLYAYYSKRALKVCVRRLGSRYSRGINAKSHKDRVCVQIK